MELLLLQQLGHHSQKAMDVLIRFDPRPSPLKVLALDRMSQMLIQSLFRHLSKVGKLYILRTMEESLQEWTRALPVTVREELTGVAMRHLSTCGGGVGGGQSLNLPVVMAATIEILFSPKFKNLSLPKSMQWHRESRTKILHLLHQKDSAVRHLSFPCYQVSLFKLEALQFSEKFILINCFYRLHGIVALHLPNVCDDELLSYVATNCPLLEELDVSGSFGITNQGLRWFSGLEELPAQHVSFASHDPPTFRGNNPGRPTKRVGFQPTPFVTATKCVGSQIRTKKVNLKIANFEGTSMTEEGLEVLLHAFKSLQSLKVEDVLWSKLLESLDKSECVSGNVTSINMVTDVGTFIPQLTELFPNLRHLTFNKVQFQDMEDIRKRLSDFSRLNAVTLKDTHFDLMYPSLRGVSGEGIVTLCFAGHNVRLDITLLDICCPNMTVLSVAHSVVLRSEQQQQQQQMKPFMTCLRSLKLWEIRCNDNVWKSWLRELVGLEKLYLWNLVINDADMEEILAQNPMRLLRDIRIGSSEIGFIRLTEYTTFRLVKSCPELRSIGGICDWNTRDMLTLLHQLLLSGGWRISLENECSN